MHPETKAKVGGAYVMRHCSMTPVRMAKLAQATMVTTDYATCTNTNIIFVTNSMRKQFKMTILSKSRLRLDISAIQQHKVYRTLANATWTRSHTDKLQIYHSYCQIVTSNQLKARTVQYRQLYRS